MKYLVFLLGLGACGPNQKPQMLMMCIENHFYYLYRFGDTASLAGRLDDNGKPVKCEKPKSIEEIKFK